MTNHGPEAFQKELDRSKERFREFGSVAVHDLREPLRAIRTNSEFLASVLGESENQRVSEHLRRIEDSIDRMETLLQDIADYCHGEGRRIQSKQTSMDDVLGEAERQLSDQLRKTEAVITHDALPAVEGDFFALATVLRHLIHNACKFRSAAAPCIHVGVSKSGPEWLFSVRDNGLGFKPAYAEAVFQPFKRFHGREYPGSGLGLAVAERIVEQHGGRMWAESAPGEGSTFWFSLPAAR